MGAQVAWSLCHQLRRRRSSWWQVSSHELYPSKEVRDGVLASGMEDGMRETMDQLDELVSGYSD